MTKKVEEMSVAELAVAYNTIAKTLKDVDAVRKFADRKTGLKRLAELQARAAAKPVKATKGKTASTGKTKPAATSIRATAHALVLAGKTNDEIFVALQKLGLPEAKRSYVSWYRSEAYRLGLAVKPKQAPKAPKAKRGAKHDDGVPEAAVRF